MNPGSAAPHHSNCFDRKPVCISVGRLYALITALLFGAAIAGCDTTAPSLYDPDRTSGPDPKIDSITPTDFALAGVDTVTIDGANFSITPSDNLVYFNDARGDIAEASATRLVVAAPNTPGADIEVRVAVLGAENYSNGVAYRLEAAAEPFGNITGFEEPFSITSDAAGNLYVSLNSDGRSVGVLRMAPDGARSPFVETTFIWTDMAYGDDNLLYTVRTVRAVFRFAEGGRQEVWGVIPDNSAKLSTIAFDEEGNLWAGGNNDNVYRIAPDKSIETFPFEANVRDLAVFDGHLYAAATREGASTNMALAYLRRTPWRSRNLVRRNGIIRCGSACACLCNERRSFRRHKRNGSCAVDFPGSSGAPILSGHSFAGGRVVRMGRRPLAVYGAGKNRYDPSGSDSHQYAPGRSPIIPFLYVKTGIGLRLWSIAHLLHRC